MQPTMHRPWDDPHATYDDSRRGGLGAVLALIAIVVIAVLAMNLGGDSADDMTGTPGDPAITETDPSLPTEPVPSTIAP